MNGKCPKCKTVLSFNNNGFYHCLNCGYIKDD